MGSDSTILVYCLSISPLSGERISQKAIAQLIGDPRYTYTILTSLSEKTRKSNHLLMSM
jgi:hypothetical protein